MCLRKKIIEINDYHVITEYYNLDLYETIKNLYETIKTIKYIPQMTFNENKTIMPYCGISLEKLVVNNEIKIKIKAQIIEFIKLIYVAKTAHRDLHIKNICWDGNQIWVIDWELGILCESKIIVEHYDLTGCGLPSPFTSGNMNIFNKHQYSVVNWLIPINLKIGDFNMNREELIKNELRKTINSKKYNNWFNSTEFGYHSFNIDEINIIGQRTPRKRLDIIKKYVDFNNKNVVDFGCNVGAMLFHLPEINNGIGFDYDDKCIDAGNNIKKILNNTKVDFNVFDFDKDDFTILREKIKFKPDIMFILSMGAWVKNIIKLLELCVELKGIIVLETNNDVIGKRELDFFKERNIEIKLIINNSEDDNTNQNKNSRKTYLIQVK